MAGVPGADDLGFSVRPVDDYEVSPDQELEAAVRSVLEGTGDELVTPDDETPEPFGFTWAFDFDTGQFIRQGGDAARVSELDALRQWCMMVLATARFARNSVASDRYGMDGLNDDLGKLVDAEVQSDMESRITDALMIHDRITAVTDFETSFDMPTGVLTTSFTVVTDENEDLEFDQLQFGEAT